MQQGWRDRLETAVKADVRSMRAISVACGFGPNYLSEVLTGKKEPGIIKLLRICQELGVSAAQIITGADVSPQAEEMLAILAGLPEKQQALLYDLARSLRKGEQP